MEGLLSTGPTPSSFTTYILLFAWQYVKLPHPPGSASPGGGGAGGEEGEDRGGAGHADRGAPPQPSHGLYTGKEEHILNLVNLFMVSILVI